MPVAPMRNWTNQKLSPYRRPDDYLPEAIRLVPATSGQTYQLSKGQVLAQRTDTGTYFDAYLASGANGTGTAKCILAYDVVVDDQGKITMSTTAGTSGDELGIKQTTTMAYFSGIFRCEDLIYNAVGPTPTVGVSAGILTDLAGKLNYGTVSAGEMQF